MLVLLTDGRVKRIVGVNPPDRMTSMRLMATARGVNGRVSLPALIAGGLFYVALRIAGQAHTPTDGIGFQSFRVQAALKALQLVSRFTPRVRREVP